MFGLTAQNLFPKKSVLPLSIYWTSRGRKICLGAKAKCKSDSIWIIPPFELRFAVPALFQKEEPVPPSMLLLTIIPGKGGAFSTTKLNSHYMRPGL